MYLLFLHFRSYSIFVFSVIWARCVETAARVVCANGVP